MASYRLYRLDRSGKILNAEWVEADSDDAALREAESRAGDGRYELWERSRRVASPPADAV